jgi:two-component system chemotaxis response regulator CheY
MLHRSFARAGAGQMKNCLVVDDSDVIRKVARRILEKMNFEITEAENGQQAIEQCKTRAPDVVLVDWMMPVMSGMEFLGALRLAKLDRKPFVVYCTTENDPADISKAMAAGADDVMLKPFDRDAIEAKLGSLAHA